METVEKKDVIGGTPETGRMGVLNEDGVKCYVMSMRPLKSDFKVFLYKQDYAAFYVGWPKIDEDIRYAIRFPAGRPEDLHTALCALLSAYESCPKTFGEPASCRYMVYFGDRFCVTHSGAPSWHVDCLVMNQAGVELRRERVTTGYRMELPDALSTAYLYAARTDLPASVEFVPEDSPIGL